MGEVLCVWDLLLLREVAMKVGHAHLMHNTVLREQFLEEARLQARLQHPNLVPVHDAGTLPDGRPWFTMDIIRGESFHAVIARVHAASLHEWSQASDGWSLHRLLAVWVQACRAVAFAHGLGVIHRDLKPHNLMVGSFGEVRVVDWGIATRILEPSTARSGLRVSGTPNYMAPEQAAASGSTVDALADVYALGAVLYELLVGHAPYSTGATAGLVGRELLDVVRSGPPLGVREAAKLPLPEELAEVVGRAMQRDPSLRYPDVNALASDVEAWLQGSHRRDVARAMVVEADATRAQALAHRRAAAELREGAARALQVIPKWAQAAEKAAAWDMEDQAIELEREADLVDAQRVQAYRAALSHAADSPEAHAALVAHHREQLLLHEQHLNPAGAAIAALHLRRHLLALPAGHPSRARGVSWLDGEGELVLPVCSADVRVSLEHLVLRQRRLVPEPVRELDPTADARVLLPAGSWLLRLRAPGRAEAVYPFRIDRGGGWSLHHPSALVPAPLELLPAQALEADHVYIPGGWFLAGGDNKAPGTPLSRRRVWVESFVVERFPVTHRKYLGFLNDLVQSGREEEALRHAPRLMGVGSGTVGPLLYSYLAGRFSLDTSASGAPWSEDTPVVLVDWHGACAYAAWMAQSTGRPWRLLDELEREKAARGVDGRFYPWGDAFDPSWCTMRDSHAGEPRPSEVESFPLDESVYGVRGMAGNVLDWTGTVYTADGQVSDGGALVVRSDDGVGRRVTRGGSWNDAASSARCATRYNLDPTVRLNFLSFRLAYTVESTLAPAPAGLEP
jgi:serine/threonine-protein kinase